MSTPSAPLAGRRIAITRPEPGDLGERLVELGASVVHVPLIEIREPADGGAALRRAAARLDAFDWLVVTSANGARRAGPAAADHPRVKLAAVGPATAAALEAVAGRPADLVPDDHRAEGLLVAFPRTRERVLVAQADRARRALADGLTSMGHTVETVIAYRTVERTPTPAEVALLADVDAAILASGSAAASWAAAIGASSTARLVAIGPVTAGDAVAHGLHDVHVATRPDTASVSDVLVALLR